MLQRFYFILILRFVAPTKNTKRTFHIHMSSDCISKKKTHDTFPNFVGFIEQKKPLSGSITTCIKHIFRHESLTRWLPQNGGLHFMASLPVPPPRKRRKRCAGRLVVLRQRGLHGRALEALALGALLVPILRVGRPGSHGEKARRGARNVGKTWKNTSDWTCWRSFQSDIFVIWTSTMFKTVIWNMFEHQTIDWMHPSWQRVHGPSKYCLWNPLIYGPHLVKHGEPTS